MPWIEFLKEYLVGTPRNHNAYATVLVKELTVQV